MKRRELVKADSPPPKAAPNRVVIMRTMDLPDGSQEKTIDLIERLGPRLMRTYRERRVIGPEEIPPKGE